MIFAVFIYDSNLFWRIWCATNPDYLLTLSTHCHILFMALYKSAFMFKNCSCHVHVQHFWKVEKSKKLKRVFLIEKAYFIDVYYNYAVQCVDKVSK